MPQVYNYALAGVARSGATRSGYTSPKVFVAINGVQYANARPVAANNVLLASLLIEEVLNETPNTCFFTMRGVEPTEGQDVVITLGSINNLDRLYAGTILNRTHRYLEKPANWVADVNCIDYTWQLTRRRVSGSFTNTPVATIAAAIVAAVPGFTLSVAAGLPTLDTFSYTDVDALSALTQLAKRVGGYCDVDYHKVVKLFITDASVTNPTDLTAAHMSLSEFAFTRDLSQVRTRIFVEGGGVTALALCVPGETIIPVETIAWYNALGGKLKSGSQHMSYAGLVAGGAGTIVGPGVAPSAAPTLTGSAGTGIEAGSHDYAYTWVTAAGETLPSPLGTIVVVGLVAAPSAPTPVVLAGAGLGIGDYKYKVGFTNASGETLPSAASPTVTTYEVAAPSAPGLANYLGGGSGNVAPVGSGLDVACVYFGASGQATARGASTHLVIGADPFSPGLCCPVDVTVPYSTDAHVSSIAIEISVNGGAYQQAYSLGNYSGGGTTVVRLANIGYSASSAGGPFSVKQVALTIPLGPAGITGRRVYRTAAGGSTYGLASAMPADNVTTVIVDALADGSLGAAPPGAATCAVAQVVPSGIGLGPTGTTARKLYRSALGAPQLKLQQTVADNTTTTGVTDTTADASLGANAPTSDTSGLSTVAGQVNAGSASLLTAGAGPFQAGGGWAVLSNQPLIRYTGISGNSLTGIPTSGPGSITSSINYGVTVTASPALIGIPSSGLGSIVYPILQGDQVNLLVQVDDVAAQATLAALLGGSDDGVVEDFIQDGTIGETEARARGVAQLALCGTVLVSITDKTTDRNAHAGRTSHVNFGSPTNLTGDFQIQHVTIDTFEKPSGATKQALFPTCTVQASSNRFSLEDLLRLARKAA